MDPKFLRCVILLNALVPAALMAWDWSAGRLGANPLEFVTRATGVLALIFLLLTLAVTPLRQLLHWAWLLKQRRLLGLLSFAYATVHLGIYVAVDRAWQLGSVLADVQLRPFIAMGMLGFGLMVPLAITSTDKMIRRLGGARWARLHRLTYYIGVAGVLHYWMIVKSDTRWPLALGGCLAVLLGYRILRKLC